MQPTPHAPCSTVSVARWLQRAAAEVGGPGARGPGRAGPHWHAPAGPYHGCMAGKHIQIRIISLLEEAANSFEQLETLANRTLRQIPADAVEAVDLRAIERDYVNDENEPGSEMDHIVFIKYRTDQVEE